MILYYNNLSLLDLLQKSSESYNRNTLFSFLIQFFSHLCTPTAKCTSKPSYKRVVSEYLSLTQCQCKKQSITKIKMCLIFSIIYTKSNLLSSQLLSSSYRRFQLVYCWNYLCKYDFIILKKIHCTTEHFWRLVPLCLRAKYE